PVGSAGRSIGHGRNYAVPVLTRSRGTRPHSRVARRALCDGHGNALARLAYARRARAIPRVTMRTIRDGVRHALPALTCPHTAVSAAAPRSVRVRAVLAGKDARIVRARVEI